MSHWVKPLHLITRPDWAKLLHPHHQVQTVRAFTSLLARLFRAEALGLHQPGPMGQSLYIFITRPKRVKLSHLHYQTQPGRASTSPSTRLFRAELLHLNHQTQPGRACKFSLNRLFCAESLGFYPGQIEQSP